MTPEQRQARARCGVHTSWANTADPTARTAKARATFLARFEKEARELHPDASEEHIRRVAEHLKKAYYARLQMQSAEARRAKKPAAA